MKNNKAPMPTEMPMNYLDDDVTIKFRAAVAVNDTPTAVMPS